MTPLVLIGAGIAAIALGSLLLRSYGPRVRVGRLLAVTPAASVAEARALAAAGARRYVRVDGRIDADDVFPDEHDRPLVFRRRRIEARDGGRWRLLEERREAVPFRVRDGLEALDVDAAALDDGLVTLVREAGGTAGETAALRDVPAALGQLPASTPVRLRVEQLSAVEHATVVGVPQARPDGAISITAGTGRPLILCTLERDEAMRVLAGGQRARPAAAAAALGAGLVLLAAGLGWALLSGGLG